MIPCNTVNIFFEKLEKASKVPLINIVEETARHVKNRNYKKVGLLATNKTIRSKLYEIPLKENNIGLILPSKKNQQEVSEVIIRILENKTSKNDKEIILKIIESLIRKGSEAIILGCTDLQLIMMNLKLKIELIDTLDVLLDSTFRTYIYKIRKSHLLGVSYG